MRQNLRTIGYALAFSVMILCTAFSASLRGQQFVPGAALLSPDQLDDLVAPIALYPDPLISQILVAVTYPLELVEATQWLQRNPGLSGLALTQAVRNQNWDPSVKGLVAFPEVLKYLTDDIAWTIHLGDAFLIQESDVMDAIQWMRARAARSGRLSSSSQLEVTQVDDSGQPVYVIEPADPDVLYVPIYDPNFIWGPALYYAYPPWHYAIHTPVLYYNRGISLSLAFGSGWHDYGWSSWNDWGWRPVWGTGNIIVNNAFINHQNFNSNHQIRTGTSSWSHEAAHRKGVSYPTVALNQRFRSPNDRSEWNGRNNSTDRPLRNDREPTRVQPSLAFGNPVVARPDDRTNTRLNDRERDAGAMRRGNAPAIPQRDTVVRTTAGGPVTTARNREPVRSSLIATPATPSRPVVSIPALERRPFRDAGLGQRQGTSGPVIASPQVPTRPAMPTQQASRRDAAPPGANNPPQTNTRYYLPESTTRRAPAPEFTRYSGPEGGNGQRAQAVSESHASSHKESVGVSGQAGGNSRGRR